MNNNYEAPDIRILLTSDDDIIATSNGIDLPDVPLGRFREDEIM